MKLTKRIALKYCAELWRDLARTGAASKSSSLLWEENSGHIPSMANSCPCCEYVVQKLDMQSDNMPCGNDNESRMEMLPSKAGCPLAGLWPKGCCVASSPYGKWLDSETASLRSKYARKIANYAEKKLKRKTP